MAAARYLQEQGWRVAVSESRERDLLDPGHLDELAHMGVEVETGGHTPALFRGADMIVPSPGVPLHLPLISEARARGAVIAGELSLAAGRIKAPVIAVTGSNGKTTVTSLIGHLLQGGGRRVFVGGNIGSPVLEYLRGGQEADMVVLELSSFQLEISGNFRPDIGLLLGLSQGAGAQPVADIQIGDTAVVGLVEDQGMIHGARITAVETPLDTFHAMLQIGVRTGTLLNAATLGELQLGAVLLRQHQTHVPAGAEVVVQFHDQAVGTTGRQIHVIVMEFVIYILLDTFADGPAIDQFAHGQGE